LSISHRLKGYGAVLIFLPRFTPSQPILPESLAHPPNHGAFHEAVFTDILRLDCHFLQLCTCAIEPNLWTFLQSRLVFGLSMDSLTTHPSNAQQARAFTSPASLSFPGGAGDATTPPSSEKDGVMAMGSQGANGVMNGQQHGGQAANGNGVMPATPAATPGANAPGSGIVPTLQ